MAPSYGALQPVYQTYGALGIEVVPNSVLGPAVDYSAPAQRHGWNQSAAREEHSSWPAQSHIHSSASLCDQVPVGEPNGAVSVAQTSEPAPPGGNVHSDLL